MPAVQDLWAYAGVVQEHGRPVDQGGTETPRSRVAMPKQNAVVVLLDAVDRGDAAFLSLGS